MPITLALPLVQRFTLERTDEAYGNEGDPTWVEFRQATQYEYLQRSAVFAEVTRVIPQQEDNGDLYYKQRWSPDELARKEIFLTLCGCNILDPETNEPLFRFRTKGSRTYLDMTEHAFNEAWGRLPPFVATEIYEKCRQLNHWDGEEGKKA